MSMGCGHCSHDRDAHLHYRSGTDCSLCDCTGFALRWSSLVRLLPAKVRRRPVLKLVVVNGARVA